ncbi:MAG TPA: transcriptional repressor [Nitrospiria bacterium]|nr:transcriptional repressor [Nitrospiria bacterium]
MTHQRLAVYQALAAVKSHPTAEEIYASLTPSYPMLSLNTVYTTLETLKSIGLIQEMRFLDNTARYDANVAPHHHVTCPGCRRVEDFEDAALDRIQPPASVKRRYQLVGRHVQFYGYCPDCRADKH